MKYFYLVLTLFISLDTFSQNGLVGDWFLHYIEVEGIQQYSTVPNSFNTISFNDDNSFDGTVCDNGYNGNYTIISETTMSIPNLVALTGFCNYPTESQLFLDPYLWSVLSDASGVTSDIFNYSIAGSDDEQTLIITNSENNSAFYGRSPLPETHLPGTWFLHSISKNGVGEPNTFSSNFKINFTLAPDSFSGIAFDGTAICNDYFGAYQLEGTDNIRFDYISFTLSFCNENGASLEESYFSFFSEAQTDTMLVNYIITGAGDNASLILTDEDGDFVIYGRQTLSVSEYGFDKLKIGLSENPVKNELILIVNEEIGNQLNYQIYSIDGKLILANKILQNHKINVNTLNSGMYFLVVSNEANFKQSLKFIKQ